MQMWSAIFRMRSVLLATLMLVCRAGQAWAGDGSSGINIDYSYEPIYRSDFCPCCRYVKNDRPILEKGAVRISTCYEDQDGWTDLPTLPKERPAQIIGYRQIDAPDAIPALGGRVRLEMVAGGVCEGMKWGTFVGFGSYRPLNLLDKIKLMSDLRFAQLYLAEYQGLATFERNGTTWEYSLADNEINLPADTKITFTDADSDNVPESCVLSYPGGATAEYEFESFSASSGAMAGPVFRLVKKVSRNGYGVTIDYNLNSSNVPQSPLTITDASGTQYACAFDSTKRITQIAVKGRTWSYSYSGYVVTETNNQTGYQIDTTLNAAHQLTSTVWRYGSAGISMYENLAYDATGKITARTINGVTLDVTEVASGNNTVVTQKLNGEDYYSYTRSKTGVVAVVSDATNSYTLTRDNMSRITSYTDPRGKTWSYGYDANGYRTSETDPDGVATTYAYDGSYNLTRKTTGSDSTYYYYDSGNLLTKTVYPDGGEERYLRYPFAADTEDADNDANTTEEHPWRGLVQYAVVKRNSSTWAASYYEYNAYGEVTKAESAFATTHPDAPATDRPGGNTYKAYAYDAWGNRTSAADELGHATTYAYDAGNRLTRSTCPVGCDTAYEYDGLGRKTKQTDGTGAYTEWSYDSRGYVTRIGGSSSAGGGGCGGCGAAAGAGGQLGDYYYSDAGLLTKFVDLNHATTHTTADTGTVYAYDAAGRRTGATDARNYATTYAYDNAGNLTAVTDANGNATSYAYTDGGRLSSVTNAESESTSYAYDSRGRQTRVTDAAGGSNVTAYDSVGRVSATTDALGHATSYAYDLAGNLTGATAPDGTASAYYYDAENRVTRTVADSANLAATSDSLYDAAGRLTRTITYGDAAQTSAKTAVTDYSYDNANRLTRVTSYPEGPAGTGQHADYAYDQVGRQTSVTSGGRTVTTTYSAAGWVSQTYDGVTTTSYCYDNVGNRTCATVSGRAAVTYYYDDANNLTKTSQIYDNGTPANELDDVALETVRAVDGAGAVTATTDAAGKTTTYAYDEVYRVTAVTNPNNETTTYAYDDAGRRTGVTFASGSSRAYTYNVGGELTATSGGPEGATSYAYDSLGRQTQVTDANSRTRATAYDTLGRVTRVANELDQPVIYAYDLAGRRTSLTDAEGNTTTYYYDRASRLTKMVYPYDPNTESEADHAELYAYDAGGLLVTKTTCNGDNIAYAYDGAGNLAGAAGVTISRDAAGAVTGDGVRSYAYDNLGRLTLATDLNTGVAVAYAYDARGLRTGMSVNGGDFAVTYAYDDALRLTSVRKGADAAATYAYDAGGRRTALTLPNGVYTSYTYDSSDRLLSLATSNGTSFAYTLDNVGNRTQITQTVNGKDDVIAYGFDNAYRLTSEVRSGDNSYSIAYAYDAVGNRTSQTKDGVGTAYTYNMRNQLVTSVSGGVTTTYSYDNNGNQTQTYDGTITKTLAYDTLNRLTSWSDGTNTETHTYAGAEWHRISTTANGVSTTYVYDGDNVVADCVAGSDPEGPSYVASKYYTTPFLDQNVGMYVISGETLTPYYYTQDGLGSVRTLSDASGVLKNAYDYTAFGETYAANTSVTVEQRYKFQGRPLNQRSNIYCYRYRPYNSNLGWMLNRNPWGYIHRNTSLYDAMNQNPVMYREPFSGAVCAGVASGFEEVFAGLGLAFEAAVPAATPNAIRDNVILPLTPHVLGLTGATAEKFFRRALKGAEDNKSSEELQLDITYENQHEWDNLCDKIYDDSKYKEAKEDIIKEVCEAKPGEGKKLHEHLTYHRVPWESYSLGNVDLMYTWEEVPDDPCKKKVTVRVRDYYDFNGEVWKKAMEEGKLTGYRIWIDVDTFMVFCECCEKNKDQK